MVLYHAESSESPLNNIAIKVGIIVEVKHHHL